MRSHGKWGDFLVATIPLSWCGNILINSNFILRMIEWQNESSLFIVRIQGKQWYWAYKYSSDTNSRINNVFINVGNNNWVRSKGSNYSLNSFNSQNTLLQYIYEYEFKKIHKSKLENSKLNNFYMKQSNIINNTYLYNDFTVLKKGRSEFLYFLNRLQYNIKVYNNKIKTLYYINNRYCKNYNLKIENIKYLSSSFFNNKVKTNKNFNIFINKYTNNNLFELDKLDDTLISSDNFRVRTEKFTVKIQKGILNKLNINSLINNTNLTNNLLFNYKIGNVSTTTKQPHFEQFWGFRQKRYKKLRVYSFSQNNKYTNNFDLVVENFLNKKNFNKYNVYTSFKNNKFKNELIPVTLARRLLRTKRTLILPVHINITLITNSYDVVHSWFVPGLGLKIDCVPGRSTHHSLYIDNVGFYYGQCAEICGRYHHHMPIRVCALPYEHFLLWWQTKGLPRMYRTSTLTKNKSILLNKFKY